MIVWNTTFISCTNWGLFMLAFIITFWMLIKLIPHYNYIQCMSAFNYSLPVHACMCCFWGNHFIYSTYFSDITDTSDIVILQFQYSAAWFMHYVTKCTSLTLYITFMSLLGQVSEGQVKSCSTSQRGGIVWYSWYVNIYLYSLSWNVSWLVLDHSL